MPPPMGGRELALGFTPPVIAFICPDIDIAEPGTLLRYIVTLHCYVTLLRYVVTLCCAGEDVLRDMRMC